MPCVELTLAASTEWHSHTSAAAKSDQQHQPKPSLHHSCTSSSRCCWADGRVFLGRGGCARRQQWRREALSQHHASLLATVSPGQGRIFSFPLIALQVVATCCIIRVTYNWKRLLQDNKGRGMN